MNAAHRKIEELLALADVRIGGNRPWDMQVHDDRLYQRILVKGTLGPGAAYMEGWWDCDNVDQFISNVIRAKLRGKIAPYSLLWPTLQAHLINLQSMGRAFQVGEAHYDLGNDRFEHMLDKRMACSCACWKDAGSLDAAEEAKLDLVCRKIGLKSGQKVLGATKKNMVNSRSRITKLFVCLEKLLCFSMLGIFVLAEAAASGQLDIRPDEAADQCDADIAQVRVTVNNVGAGGILSVELYNDPDNFLNKKGRTRRIRIPASAGLHMVCFIIEQQGTYAVAAYHDVDGNRKLKRRWNKMPDEPFGLSNNPKLKLGFPKFGNSAFATDSLGADITINLQQP